MTRLDASRFATSAARSALVIGLLVAVSGCRNYRTMEELEQSRAELEELEADPAFAAPDDPLEAGFERARRLFVPGGSTRFGELERVRLDRRGAVDRVVTLGPPVCYAFLAYGEGDGLDIDLRVDGPDGQKVGEDAAPDPFPVIPSYCPPAAGPHVLRLRAARGGGEAIFGVYALPQESAAATGRIGGLAERYLFGARAIGPVATERVVAREAVSHGFAVLPGRCYGVVAVGEETVVDLDLELVDDRGEVLTRDLGTDAEPVVQRYCADRGGVVRVRVEPYEGAGRVWWQVFEVGLERADLGP